MKKFFLKDIADQLGVSIATVSLVLNSANDKGRVSEEVSQKIRALALKMDYQPNSIARSLRIGKSNTLGLVVADISNSFFGSLSFFIQEYAEKKGYAVIIGNSNEQKNKLKATINILRSRQVDGLIIVPTTDCESIIAPLTKSRFPTILLDRYIPNLTTSFVVVDNYKASYDATSLLVSKGCKKIALIAYKNNMTHMSERKQGYIDALLEAGSYEPTLLKEVEFKSLQKDMESAMSEIISSSPPVDGIYFASNSISLAGIGSLIRKNINVERAIKIVCFDKNDAFAIKSNMVSYVQQPIEQMAKEAIDILINQIEKGGKEIQCKLSATLIKV